MPTVFIADILSRLSGDFNIGALPNLNSQSSSKSVIIVASMPIFDGDLRTAQLNDAQNIANITSETQLNAVTEIILAANALKTALATSHAADIFIQTSNVAFDASLEAYNNGFGTITVVKKTNNSLLNARLA